MRIKVLGKYWRLTFPKFMGELDGDCTSPTATHKGIRIAAGLRGTEPDLRRYRPRPTWGCDGSGNLLHGGHSVMPCNEDAAYYAAKEQQKQDEFRKYHNLVAAVACEACGILICEGNDSKLSKQARDWYEQHQKADALRKGTA